MHSVPDKPTLIRRWITALQPHEKIRNAWTITIQYLIAKKLRDAFSSSAEINRIVTESANPLNQDDSGTWSFNYRFPMGYVANLLDSLCSIRDPHQVSLVNVDYDGITIAYKLAIPPRSLANNEVNTRFEASMELVDQSPSGIIQYLRRLAYSTGVLDENFVELPENNTLRQFLNNLEEEFGYHDEAVAW